MKAISIIIPTLNDEKIIKNNINILKKKLNKYKIKYEIIIINDGSRDQTSDILSKLKKNDKKIKIIENKKNFGKSYSVRKGIKKSKYKFILLIDSDLPYFKYFYIILKKLKSGYDFVYVNRKHKKSLILNKKLNFYQKARKIIGDFLSILIQILFDLKSIKGDTQSGLKGFKKINEFNKLEFISNKFFLDLEIIYLYKVLNKKFCPVPVKYKIDDTSTIKLFSFNNFFILIELIKIFFKTRIFIYLK